LGRSAIQYALNLNQVSKVPLSQAYARAVAQFRALRSEHHIATTFAVLEAEELGATFVRGEIEHAFEKEKRAVATWEKEGELDEAELIARKRWKMIAERHVGETDWSKGVQYVKMWQAGNRVNYSPALTRQMDEENERVADEDEDDDDEDSGEPGPVPGAASEIMTTEEFDELVSNRVMGDFEAGEGYEEEQDGREEEDETAAEEEAEEEGDEEIAEAEEEAVAEAQDIGEDAGSDDPKVDTPGRQPR
jgi:hypothetical protein